MFNSSNGMTPADYAAINGNNNEFGNGGWLWWIIIIFMLAGWGNGMNGNSGVQDQYTLASDFATLQRQIDSTATNTQNIVATNADQLQRQVTSIGNGISSLGYDQLNHMNSINANIASSTYDLSTQLNTIASNQASCCCSTQNAINTGFADTNYRMATDTCAINTNVSNVARDINDTTNAGIQAILAKLNDQEMNAKQAQIDALTQQVNALTLAASQQAQNNYIVSALRPSPSPAYVVANPYTSYSYGCSGCSAT